MRVKYGGGESRCCPGLIRIDSGSRFCGVVRMAAWDAEGVSAAGLVRRKGTRGMFYVSNTRGGKERRGKETIAESHSASPQAYEKGVIVSPRLRAGVPPLQKY